MCVGSGGRVLPPQNWLKCNIRSENTVRVCVVSSHTQLITHTHTHNFTIQKADIQEYRKTKTKTESAPMFAVFVSRCRWTFNTFNNRTELLLCPLRYWAELPEGHRCRWSSCCAARCCPPVVAEGAAATCTEGEKLIRWRFEPWCECSLTCCFQFLVIYQWPP